MIFWYKEYEAPISERVGEDMQSRALRNVFEILSKFGNMIWKIQTTMSCLSRRQWGPQLLYRFLMVEKS